MCKTHEEIVSWWTSEVYRSTFRKHREPVKKFICNAKRVGYREYDSLKGIRVYVHEKHFEISRN